MATDEQRSTVLLEQHQGSAIENELPTYRAISWRAILSLLLGILALFILAHPFFYLCAVLAVLLGITADWNIQRYSDILTGRKLAQTGVALGLIFGLGIFTVTTVQSIFRSRHAASYAKYYAEVAKTASLPELMMLGIPPSQRSSVSPEDLMKRFESTKRKDPTIEMKLTPIRSLKKRLDSSKEQEIHFVKLEKEGTEKLTYIALALFEIDGPETKEFPQKEEFALVRLHGSSEGGKGFEWWVDDVSYPYKPSSATIPEKSGGDGHGHVH
ncbi:MAG: DUF4190 domain-containing protein [Isosphaeraceae bacterium]